MMNEQQYRLEENNITNELILWEDIKILNIFKNSYDNRKHLNIIVDRLNKLYEENKKLKHINDQLEDELEESSACIIEQREENKHLRKSEKINMEYAEQIVEDAIDEMVTDYKKLEKENEQLRKQLDFYLLDEFEWKEKYGDCDKDE